MVMPEFYSNLGHSGVAIFWMVNVCNGLNLMAYSRPGQSVRRHIGWSGVTLTCIPRRILQLNGSRKIRRRWLCFGVIKDLLNNVCISDVGDDMHGSKIRDRRDGRLILSGSSAAKPCAARLEPQDCKLCRECLPAVLCSRIIGIVGEVS